MLPFLHYCYVCGVDVIVAVVTKCCIFFEGHMCLYVYLLPYTQTITLTKTELC